MRRDQMFVSYCRDVVEFDFRGHGVCKMFFSRPDGLRCFYDVLPALEKLAPNPTECKHAAASLTLVMSSTCVCVCVCSSVKPHDDGAVVMRTNKGGRREEEKKSRCRYMQTHSCEVYEWALGAS